MQASTQVRPASKGSTWAGWIIGTIPALFLLSSAISMCAAAPYVLKGLAHLGYPQGVALGIGLAELAGVLLYLIPRTSVLGAILLTGFLGGATASHVRAGEMFFAPIIIGILFWGGLWLRSPRLRTLLFPRTRTEEHTATSVLTTQHTAQEG